MQQLRNLDPIRPRALLPLRHEASDWLSPNWKIKSTERRYQYRVDEGSAETSQKRILDYSELQDGKPQEGETRKAISHSHLINLSHLNIA